jgi:pimeloyl-ACP methyl ester carboxylesterase
MAGTEAQTGYAQVGDLRMYYEVHGSGRPALLLHGAYMTVDSMAPLLSGLAESRRVIAAEQQGHGRTADVDRPITYEQMADDTAALARQLEIGEADVVGYSMGAGIGLQLAIRHPSLVRKLVVASASFTSDGMHAAALEMFPSITPELFAGSPMEQDYLRLAPNPGDFPTLVEKLKALDTTPFAWPEEDIRAIAAPTLIALGDSDVVRLEHAIELFKLRGGGVMGDLAGLPSSQLAVLPGTTHFMPPGSGVLDRAEWLLPMISAFLDAAMPAREPDELDEVVDEFGDRSGPDPAREPELELGDEEPIVETPPDGEGDDGQR